MINSMKINALIANTEVVKLDRSTRLVTLSYDREWGKFCWYNKFW